MFDSEWWVVVHKFDRCAYHVLRHEYWAYNKFVNHDDYMVLSVEDTYNAALGVKQMYEHDYSDRCYLSI